MSDALAERTAERMSDDELAEHVATAKRLASLHQVRLPELLRGAAALVELVPEVLRLRAIEMAMSRNVPVDPALPAVPDSPRR